MLLGRMHLVAALLVLLSRQSEGQQLRQQCHPGDPTCSILTVEVFPNGEVTGGVQVTISQLDCERATDLGEVLSPHLGCGDLANPSTGFCSAFTEVGMRVTTCTDISPNEKLFLVPRNRHFVWPTHYIGYSVNISHVQTPNNQPIMVETIAEHPKMFRLHNFLTVEEADSLVQHALEISDDEYKLKRSSTGPSGYNIDSKRTSENAFDTGSPAATALKKRCFEVLGIHPYDESKADGLQILRYNVSKAYNSHLDYFDVGGDFDYDSAAGGSNRFATILLYLSDVEAGGETVFPKSSPAADHPHPDYIGLQWHDAMTKLEAEGALENLPQGGWERSLVYDCRTKLTVKPMKAGAVLFYSQLPDGRLDEYSLHGACPVLTGQKWAANLWVWNGPRRGFSASAEPKTASFETQDVVGAELYYEETKWEDLTIGYVVHVNTYEGHRWFVHLQGHTVLMWVIDERPSQRFVLRQADLDLELH